MERVFCNILFSFSKGPLLFVSMTLSEAGLSRPMLKPSLLICGNF